MASPSKNQKEEVINFIDTPEEFEAVSKLFKSAKKKKPKKKQEPVFLCPSIEIPPELLIAKQKIIDEVFGGVEAWNQAVKKVGGKHGLENVSAIRIGQKRNGKNDEIPTATLCVIIEVLTKAAQSKIHKEFRIPEWFWVGNQIVFTDVQVGKKVTPHAVLGGDLVGVNRPSPKGFEIGTIGCFCTIVDDDGKSYAGMLTNSHVIGDYLGAGVQELDAIHHEAGPDGLHIGRYFRSARDGVDAAIAFVKKSEVDIHGHRGLVLTSDLDDAGDGQKVLCYGGRSGPPRGEPSIGRVRKPHMDSQVRYTVGERRVEETFEIVSENPDGTPFSIAGDSGAIIVDAATNAPVGLLIGALGEGSPISVAHHIGFVCDELNIRKIMSAQIG